jgi:hypothetical protein
LKELISKIIFLCFDLLTIVLSLYLAFLTRNSFQGAIPHDIPFSVYLQFFPLYIIVLALFTYEGVYTYRYDFWHESRLILKALLFAALLVFAYLAMTKTVEHYSRFVFGVSFIYMLILIPIEKKIVKNSLSKLKLWQKKAKIYEDDPFLTQEIYNNPYLGYCRPKKGERYSTVFINSKESDLPTLKKRIATQLKKRDEVIYIPVVDEYNLTLAHIYELSATRTNLIVYENRLKSWYRQLLQSVVNYILVLLLLPILLPVIAIIALFIKLESPGPIFFIHNRIGKDGKSIPVIKFRSMYKDAKKRLEKLLQSDDCIKEEWESCFKLKEDPRVTKVGRFLRKTSLDELPQIFNVLFGHMN